MKSVSMHKSVLALVALVTMGFLSAAPASASLIVSIQNGSAAPGSNGNSFEVDVTNTDSVADVINSFAFEVTTSDSDITFTNTSNATTNLAYIFASDTEFAPFLSVSSPGQSMDGSDDASDAGFSQASGSTIGLGEVFYNVANGATPGVFTISFSPSSATSFSDINANAFVADSSNTGTITISAATTAAPEPSTLGILGLAVTALALVRKKLPAKA